MFKLEFERMEKKLTAITSRSHQGIWSPPPKNEETDSKNLPIVASIKSVNLANLRKWNFPIYRRTYPANLSEKEMRKMIAEEEIEFGPLLSNLGQKNNRLKLKI